MNFVDRVHKLRKFYPTRTEKSRVSSFCRKKKKQISHIGRQKNNKCQNWKFVNRSKKTNCECCQSLVKYCEFLRSGVEQSQSLTTECWKIPNPVNHVNKVWILPITLGKISWILLITREGKNWISPFYLGKKMQISSIFCRNKLTNFVDRRNKSP